MAARKSAKPLSGRVALVAGATRGAGRGIARALGEVGATVYCTGRSSRGGRVDRRRPETIEETAELVDAAGGQGIAVRVDHLVEAEVARLCRRIGKEQGRLDVLVNDVWGGDDLTEWGKPFWKLDLEKGFAMMRTAIHSHVVTAKHAAPLILKGRNPLLVEITDGDGFAYRGTLFYDLVKTTVTRLAWDFHEELASKGVTSLAVTPGFLRSERMLEHFGVTEANWRDGAKRDAGFAFSETPLFVGRAIAALAADPGVAKKSGRVYASWTLAREYGFRDADGSRPDWGRYAEKAYPGMYRPADDAFYAYWEGYQALKRALGGSVAPPEPATPGQG